MDYHRMWLNGRVPEEQQEGGRGQKGMFATFDAFEGWTYIDTTAHMALPEEADQVSLLSFYKPDETFLLCLPLPYLIAIVILHNIS